MGSARGDAAVWAKQLAFVYDVRQPTSVRISIGGTLAPAGLYQPVEDAPDPASVSAATGRVSYHVRWFESGRAKSAVLWAELLAPDQVRVEFFTEPRAESAGFTSAALVYVR